MLSDANVDYMLGVTVRELAKMTRKSRSEDRVFHYLPFCFAGSRIMLWSQLHRGNPLLLSTDLTRLQQELAVAAPHYCLNVPALLERIRAGVSTKVAGMGGAVAPLYARAVRASVDIASDRWISARRLGRAAHVVPTHQADDRRQPRLPRVRSGPLS